MLIHQRARCCCATAATRALTSGAHSRRHSFTFNPQACCQLSYKLGPPNYMGVMGGRCLKPPLEEIPEGSWHCADCASRILCEVQSNSRMMGSRAKCRQHGIR